MVWLKRLIATLLTLVVLLVVAVVVIYLVVDPNDYKGHIETAVEDATGRSFKLTGDIELSVFPWLGLDLAEASLGNPEGFGDQPFASIQSANVHVGLMPLLSQRLEVDRVHIQGLTLNLRRDAAGKTNWQDLMQAGDAAQATGQPRTAPQEGPAQGGGPAGAAAGLPMALQVAGLEISNARITWQDAQSGEDVVIDPLHLEAGALEIGKPTPVELELQMSRNEGAMTLAGELTASMLADLEGQQYALRDLAVDTQLGGSDLPMAELPLALRADLSADMAEDTARVADLEIESAGLRISGQLRASKISSQPSATGRLESNEFSPREVMQELGLALPETRDDQVLRKASLGFSLDAGPTSARIRELRLRLDDTRGEGQVTVADYTKPAVDFQLDLDAIDMDRYMPAPSGKEEEQEPAPVPVALPIEPLRKLDLDGKVTLDRLKAQGMTLENITLTLDAEDGVVEVKPLALDLYGGSMESQARIDVQGEVPRLALRHALDGVQAAPLLEDLRGKAQIEGTTKLDADLKTAGKSIEALKKGLNGSLSVAFRDGAVRGVNIAQMIRDARARLEGKTPAASDVPKKTDFAVLRGSAKIRDGVAKNDDLQMKSPLLRIKGGGTADLVEETTDYRLEVAVVGTLKGQGGEELTEVKGVNIPLRIKGPFADPKFSLDLGSVLEEKVKARVEEEVEKKKGEAKEKIQKKLEEELGGEGKEIQDRLKGLFN